MKSETSRPSIGHNASNAIAVLLCLMGLVLHSIAVTPPQDAKPKPQSAEAFRPPFQKFNPELRTFTIIERRRMDPHHSLILVSATSQDKAAERHSGYLLNSEVLGVFVSIGVEPQPSIELDIFPSESHVRILEAGPNHAVIAKKAMSYGLDLGRVKYFYDLKAGKRLSRFSYSPVAVSLAVEFEATLYFVASLDQERGVIARLSQDPAEPLRGNAVIRHIHGREIPRVWRAKVEGRALVLEGGDDRFSLASGVWKVEQNPQRQDGAYHTSLPPVLELGHVRLSVPPSMAQENVVEMIPTRRLLIWDRRLYDGSRGGEAVSGIYDIRDGSYQFHPLPQSEHEAIPQYRPAFARRFGSPWWTVREEIGPFQLSGNRLWFGVTFYDGEGLTGVGGIGTFDLRTGQYSRRHDPELLDWSASALLVEGSDLWMGLIVRPEGAVDPGGLARIPLEGGPIRKYRVPAVIHRILKFRGALYLATSEGIFIVDRNNLVHVNLDPDRNGEYSLRSSTHPLVPQP
jgi:hypothetical protein